MFSWFSRNVGPDLDPKLYDSLKVFLKDSFKKSEDDNKSMKNYPACKDSKELNFFSINAWI